MLVQATFVTAACSFRLYTAAHKYPHLVNNLNFNFMASSKEIAVRSDPRSHTMRVS